MSEYLHFIFSDFWIFVGNMLLIFGLLELLFRVYNRALRHRHVMKYGYPPEHCDADGDFPTCNCGDEEEEEKKD